MEAKQIRIGVVGTNFVSDWLCDAVNESGAACVTAVYSRAQQTGDTFARTHQIGAVYTDYETMLSESGIHAVYIASPTMCHCEQAIMALQAGKHVLTEKPAGLNASQFSRMCHAAKKADRILLEAMRPVFDPALEQIRTTLGMLGTLRHATFDFCQYSSRYDRFLAGEHVNAFDPALSNAAVMDVGVYAAAVMVYLFGTPLPGGISATSTFLRNGMEGSGCILCKYPTMEVVLRYAKTYQSENRCEIYGEKGTLTFCSASQPKHLVLHLRGEKEQPIPLPLSRHAQRTNVTNTNVAAGDVALRQVTHLAQKRHDVPHNMVHEVRAFCDLIHSQRERQSYYWSLTQQTLHVLDVARHQTGVSFAADSGETEHADKDFVPDQKEAQTNAVNNVTD